MDWRLLDPRFGLYAHEVHLEQRLPFCYNCVVSELPIIGHNGGATMKSTATKVGRRGTIVVPAEFRKRYGLEEGALVIVEESADGILIRPAIAVPLESYTPARQAEFLLSNAVDAEDYARAVDEVRRMGVDPAVIPHYKPAV